MSDYSDDDMRLLRERWVAALRSGEYKQGSCALRPTDDTYCCLGVLCDVLGLEWVKYESDTPGFWAIPAEGEPMKTALTEDIIKKVGMAEEAIKYLILRNDGGVDFSTIANMIENDPILTYLY